MNLFPESSVIATCRRRQRGFTMVEIALCLAIIAFALVAIIGVLPIGMRAQQDNREETIINQDATYFLEAIRSGAEGLDELTNYVDEINVGGSRNWRYVNVTPADTNNVNHLWSGLKIIGVLSYPRYQVFDNETITNVVTARVRSISGSAASKDPEIKDFAFTYQLTTEIVPLNIFPTEYTNYNENGLSQELELQRSNSWYAAQNVTTNFHELRLTFQWPVYTTGANTVVGNYRKTFRTLVSGRHAWMFDWTEGPPPANPTLSELKDRHRLYLFRPNEYTRHTVSN